MTLKSLNHSFHRILTLKTHRISALPILILMPHSACNCRCIMCDIWKGNSNLKQIQEEDVIALLGDLKKLGTQQVVMSGGEALLNPNFFRLCKIFQDQNIKVSLLSTGLTIKFHAESLLKHVHELIISLDGNQLVHNSIRNVPQAYQKLKEGISFIKALNPKYKISARTVIQKLNFRIWDTIIIEAKEMGLDRISFLPADVSLDAFNRTLDWDEPRKEEILISEQELPELMEIIKNIGIRFKKEFSSGFLAESHQKLEDIYWHYSAIYGLNPFPNKKCNAPWVSTVIEADGTVRPCFFLKSLGNIRNQSLKSILNSKLAIERRKGLILTQDPCLKCVCSLNLNPLKSLA